MPSGQNNYYNEPIHRRRLHNAGSRAGSSGGFELPNGVFMVTANEDIKAYTFVANNNGAVLADCTKDNDVIGLALQDCKINEEFKCRMYGIEEFSNDIMTVLFPNGFELQKNLILIKPKIIDNLTVNYAQKKDDENYPPGESKIFSMLGQALNSNTIMINIDTFKVEK